MSSNIPWVANLEGALSKAKETGKLVLLDFFSPT
jgi:hypothetical protein